MEKVDHMTSIFEKGESHSQVYFSVVKMSKELMSQTHDLVEQANDPCWTECSNSL